MGIIMLGIFFLLSIDKEHELKEEIRHEQSRMQEEELKRQQEEMSELEALERELTEKKLKDKLWLLAILKWSCSGLGLLPPLPCFTTLWRSAVHYLQVTYKHIFKSMYYYLFML